MLQAGALQCWQLDVRCLRMEVSAKLALQKLRLQGLFFKALLVTVFTF